MAKILSCTEEYVCSLIREGSLLAIKIGVRALRVSENSINDFIAARRVNPEDYFAPEEKNDDRSKPIKNIVRSNWMNSR